MGADGLVPVAVHRLRRGQWTCCRPAGTGCIAPLAQEKAKELLELKRADTPFDDKDNLWQEIDGLFRAVEDGNTEWACRSTAGFRARPGRFRASGALLAEVSLSNTASARLRALLTIHTAGEEGPVDFRSLSVREFGTVYEGLLESELSVAEVDLTVDDAAYRPCRAGEEPLVRKQQIYLHNCSRLARRPAATSPRSSPSSTCSTTRWSRPCAST
jgi:hypothetical protein